MDKILMNNLGFYGYHGVFKRRSYFRTKVLYRYGALPRYKRSCQTDDMNKSVSYADVYELVKEIVENKRFKFIRSISKKI